MNESFAGRPPDPLGGQPANRQSWSANGSAGIFFARRSRAAPFGGHQRTLPPSGADLSGRFPALSIIVPCLNEAAILAERLDALQPLRARGHEIILVDGGSADATLALAAGRVDLCLRSRPGRARQQNRGARAANGRVLWFLHLDSHIPAAADAAILAAAGDGGWGRFDVRLSGGRRVFRVIETLMNWRSRVTGICTGDQGLFVHRDAFTAVGGFPGVELMEDVALSRRLKRRAAPVCLRERLVTSSRRWESNGVLRTVLLMWCLRLAYFFGVAPARLARWYRPVTGA